MPVKIPTYDQQTVAQGGFINTKANFAEVSGAEGRAIEKFGDAATTAIALKANADALASAQPKVAQADLQWNKWILDTPNTLPNNGDGLTGKFQQEFKTFREQTLANETNPVARRILSDHLDKMEVHYGKQSQQIEAKATYEFRKDAVENAYQSWGALVAQNPSMLGTITESMDTMIANSNFDPVTRNNLAVAYRQKLATAYGMGRAKTDPEGWKKTLDSAYSGGMSGFDNAVKFVLGVEGGYSAVDGKSGAPVNFGINQKYNPDIDVKNLTKEKATQIYKERYWNAIDGDNLPPSIQMIAMDTAVNQGVAVAKKFIAESGGDPEKFLQLREARYGKTDGSDAEKKSWQGRVDKLRGMVANNLTPSETDALAIKNIGIEHLPTMINHTTSELHRQQAVYRSQIGTIEADHSAMFLNGETVTKPLTQADYIKAYGEIDGAQRFVNYQANMQLGADIQTMKSMPFAQQKDFLESKKPQPNTAGYEMGIKRHEILAQAIDKVNQQRVADPMGYAMNNKLSNVQPLNFSDPRAVGRELNGRIGTAETMQTQYGTGYALLTKNEVAQMTAGLSQMTDGQKLSFLKGISDNVSNPKAFQTIMGQIAPDSPATAVAGNILSKRNPMVTTHWFSADEVLRPEQVASTILKGEAVLNPSKTQKEQDGKPSKILMPKEQDLRTQFEAVVGNAYAGRANSANADYQAVKAYYAGKMVEANGGTSDKVDNAVLKEAIRAVTGGVSNYNSKGDVIMPWGMDESAFRNAVHRKIQQYEQSSNADVGGSSKAGLYGLKLAEQDKYYLTIGTGFVSGKDGKPVIIDLSSNPYVPLPDEPKVEVPQPNPVAKGSKTDKMNNQHLKTK